MNTKHYIQRAQEAVSAASYSPKKITAIHAGIAASAGLIVALLSYLLSTGMGDTGGLGGIGTRAALETAQSMLQLLVAVATPFWSMGFLATALQWARRKSAETKTLLQGFRKWGPALRLMILEGVIYIALLLLTSRIGSALYFMTPYADALNALVLQLTESGITDTAALTQMLLEQDTAVMMKIFWSMLPFLVIPAMLLLIPLSYRLRLARFIVMDHPRCGGIYAVALSLRLMKKNCMKLFLLDLRLWWFYALEVVVQLLCYGELVLPLMGISLNSSGVLVSFLFYALALLCQLGLYVWKKPQVITSYALFFDDLLQQAASEYQS